jgi:hypothetical protein
MNDRSSRSHTIVNFIIEQRRASAFSADFPNPAPAPAHPHRPASPVQGMDPGLRSPSAPSVRQKPAARPNVPPLPLALPQHAAPAGRADSARLPEKGPEGSKRGAGGSASARLMIARPSAEAPAVLGAATDRWAQPSVPPSFCSPACGQIAFALSLPRNRRAPERTCTRARARMRKLVRRRTRTRTRARTCARTLARTGHHPASLAVPLRFSGYHTHACSLVRSPCGHPSQPNGAHAGRCRSRERQRRQIASHHRPRRCVAHRSAARRSRWARSVRRSLRAAHRHRDSAHLHHTGIRAGTRLGPATSALGLGSPLPHLRWDWAHPHHIDTGTRLIPATSALGLEVAWCAGH